ncbi:hypothetical protein ACFLSJ_02780 [Verrucomicrobiota bacterium]
MDHGDSYEVAVPRADDFDFNAQIIRHPETGVYWLVKESCPCWGLDERVGLHRDLSLLTLAPGERTFRHAPNTCNGHVRIRPEAFLSQSSQNLTPVHPRLFPDGDSVGLTFRRFRFTGLYPHGWDTYVMRAATDGWSEPVRVSPNSGHGDAAYAVVVSEDCLTAFCPSCDVEPFLTFDEEAAGLPWRRRERRATDQRVEIVAFGDSDFLPPTDFPRSKRSTYVVPPSVHDVASDPPPVAACPEARTLIWADLHAHSAYSKCMGCNDGTPRDVLRFQRDVLGCHVLCLTDHVEYMNGGEFAHVLDCVERECGEGRIPLYGVEWARFPAHHTNFLAADREVFERLRTLLFLYSHLTSLYGAMRRELPDGSVAAIRHMHGEDHDAFGVSGTRVAETHDPRFEWAMEAMQTRGNALLDGMRGMYPRFPANFLHAGCEVGIVGGSDHSRGAGPNSFCLTGLWVREMSGSGVIEALRTGNTFGVANGKMALHVDIDGASGGRHVAVSGPVRAHVHMACARAIRRVCLMRDGELLAWQDVARRQASVVLVDAEAAPGSHWYVVTVEGADAYPKAPLLAHSSPLFVKSA